MKSQRRAFTPVRLTLQDGQDPVQGAALGPPVKPPPNRLPRREITGQVMPKRSRAKPPNDRLDHLSMVGSPPTPTRRPIRQQRLQASPHRTGQHTTIGHEDHPAPSNRTHLPDTP
jgi:hypothetical protein